MDVQAPQKIATHISRDCANKIQISCNLPYAFEEEQLAIFNDLEAKIHRFSLFSPGAKDQFSCSDHTSILIKGIIGDPKITITLWKEELEEGKALLDHYLLRLASGETTN